MTHVLAVRLDNDGDVLLAGPAIRALAARRRPRDAAVRPARPARRGAAARASTSSWSGARPGSTPSPTPVDRGDVDGARRPARGAARSTRAVIFGSFHQSPLPTALLLRLAGVPFVAATSRRLPRRAARRPPPDRRRRARGRARARPRRRRRASRSPPGDDGALRVRRGRARRGRSASPTSSCTRAPPCPRAPGRPTRSAALVRRARRRAAAASSSPAARASAALTARVAGPPRPG